MAEPLPRINDEIERYLRTGESDPCYGAWGDGFMERASRAHNDLRGALICEVKRLAKGLSHAPILESDIAPLTRSKVEPMVRGLFPQDEQEAVLTRLERSVVFISTANFERVLIEEPFDHSAWMLANLYLASLGAELLADYVPSLVGMSVETTCFVSAEYFAQNDPFADFIVHEAAHIFHNCKRATLGLHESRKGVWLLDVEYHNRETFAYACEAYSRVLERAGRP